MYISEQRRETIGQFIRFALVGFSNTVVDFSMYVALTRLIPFFGAHIYAANTISFVIAATWSYIANRKWTFESQSRANVREAVKFYTATGTGFFINTAVLFLFVNELGVYDLVGKAGAIGISTIWNFILNKMWVFKK